MVQVGVVAVIDGVELRGKKGFLGITGADEDIKVEIEVRGHRKVLSVNMGPCVFRVCRIRGKIEITDRRSVVRRRNARP